MGQGTLVRVGPGHDARARQRLPADQIRVMSPTTVCEKCSTIILEYSEKEPALQCRRQDCAPDSSSLKSGPGATEGVLDYGVLGEPIYVTWAGLMGREDTRWKTFPRVRMGLSFAWKTSLVIRILYLFPCNRLCVNPSPLRCLYKLERLVLRRPIAITIIIIIG